MSWFRKSTVQPVTTFAPVLNTAVSPQIIETLDPEIGIAREFQITGPVWGRYEVWKQWDADPDPQRLAWRQRVQATDVTAPAGSAGTGNVWRVRSIGYVFRQVDPNVPFDQAPNQMLGSDILGSEIRRMTLSPPGQAAVCSRTASATTIVTSVNIQGGTGVGVFSKSGTGSVTRTGSPTIAGVSQFATIASYDDSVEAVFGVSEKELQALADDNILAANSFPSPVATNYLYFVEVPTLTYSAALPLRGTAAIYVKGNVVFNVGNKSYFTGLLYVNGNLTIREPCDLNGTIICNGTVRIEGQSDWVNITYDDEALNALRTAIGQYRLSAAIRKVLSSE